MSGGRDVANREITNKFIFFIYLKRKKEANSREKMN